MTPVMTTITAAIAAIRSFALMAEKFMGVRLLEMG
jgi:hypothetical protein